MTQHNGDGSICILGIANCEIGSFDKDQTSVYEEVAG